MYTLCDIFGELNHLNSVFKLKVDSIDIILSVSIGEFIDVCVT